MSNELERIYMRDREFTLEEWKKILTPYHASAVAETIGSYCGPLGRREVFNIIVAYQGGVATGEEVRMLLEEVYGLYL